MSAQRICAKSQGRMWKTMRNDNETTNELIHALRGVYDYDYISQQPYDMVTCDRRNVDVRQTQGAINAYCDKHKVRLKQ